jgi:hypothetical protein
MGIKAFLESDIPQTTNAWRNSPDERISTRFLEALRDAAASTGKPNSECDTQAFFKYPEGLSVRFCPDTSSAQWVVTLQQGGGTLVIDDQRFPSQQWGDWYGLCQRSSGPLPSYAEGEIQPSIIWISKQPQGGMIAVNYLTVDQYTP